MRKIEIIELRERQMQILDYVAGFCDRNGIRYWLDSGTLLGAIRHKGYIPWDDDIDIGMLREDYDRFQKLFSEKCDRPDYVFRGPETDNDWHLPIGKVMDMTTLLLQDGHELGINIDIFPFDDAPDDEDEMQRMYQVRDRLKILNAASLKKTPPSGNLLRRCVVYGARAILHLFPRYWFIREISRRARRYNGKNLRKVGNFAGEAKIKPTEKRLVETTIDAVFEDRIYKIPEFYDQWLNAFYGSNYMQLPPEDKRKRHSFEAYVND